VPTGVMDRWSSELSVRFGVARQHVSLPDAHQSTDGLRVLIRPIQSGRSYDLDGGADAPLALAIVKGFILMKIPD